MDWFRCIGGRLLRAARREVGITLVETVMAIGLFGVVSASLVGVLTSATVADGLSRQRSIALQLAQQQLEYVRQLNYANVGTVNGNPPGVVRATQTKQVMGLWYTLKTQIKWVNDPVPTSFATFANYKHVLVTVSRKSDGKELARSYTYLSSSTRAPFGGVNNAIVNVVTKDYWTQNLLGNVQIDLYRTPGTFHASDVTGNVEGSPDFGQITFAALEPTESSEYYDVYASLAGYQTLKDDLPPSTAAHLQLAPSGTVNTTIRLYKPSSIYVRVIDEATGLLYSGSATVTISSPRGSQSFATTDGTVSILAPNTLAGEPVVPGNNYSITVDTPNNRHGELKNQTVPSDYSLESPSSTFDVILGTAIIPRTATLTVHVRRIRTMTQSCWSSTDYVNNASVTINDPSIPYSASKSTNSSGQVVFTNIPVGVYDITARARISSQWRENTIIDQVVNADTSVCVGLYAP